MSKFRFNHYELTDVLVHGPSGVVIARVRWDGQITSMDVFETAQLPRDFDRDALPPVHAHYEDRVVHRQALQALVDAVDAAGGYNYLPETP